MAKTEALKNEAEGMIYNGDPTKWYSFEREIRSWLRLHHGNVGLKVWDGCVGEINQRTKSTLKDEYVADIKKRRGLNEYKYASEANSMNNL